MVDLYSDQGLKIKYTTDGSSPFMKSAKIYEKPFKCDTNCFLRAVCFGESYLSKLEARKAYVDTSLHKLPIVSLLIDPDTLWNEEMGLFGNPWSIHKNEAIVEMYNFGQTIQSYDIKTRVFGSGTRLLDKKSITIFATTLISNTLFGNRNNKYIDGFILRSVFPSNRFKNELVHDINEFMKGHVAIQEFQPAVLYIRSILGAISFDGKKK